MSADDRGDNQSLSRNLRPASEPQHYYSTASATIFSLLRIARGLLELAALARLLLSADRQMTKKVLALVVLRGVVGPVVRRLEREVD
ncbi:MAG TPA: hypothetical protein VHR18_01205 [Solirubrobacterales bacterium]|nr:hypothetical protein [Solirubrobacterales bacterium]